jgi:hypothetical protein
MCCLCPRQHHITLKCDQTLYGKFGGVLQVATFDLWCEATST